MFDFQQEMHIRIIFTFFKFIGHVSGWLCDCNIVAFNFAAENMIRSRQREVKNTSEQRMRM